MSIRHGSIAKKSRQVSAVERLEKHLENHRKNHEGIEEDRFQSHDKLQKEELKLLKEKVQ